MKRHVKSTLLVIAVLSVLSAVSVRFIYAYFRLDRDLIFTCIEDIQLYYKGAEFAMTNQWMHENDLLETPATLALLSREDNREGWYLILNYDSRYTVQYMNDVGKFENIVVVKAESRGSNGVDEITVRKQVRN